MPASRSTCDFSNNRIENFESRDNRDHGMFIRLASGNIFVGGLFAGNKKNGIYFDRARVGAARDLRQRHPLRGRHGARLGALSAPG